MFSPFVGASMRRYVFPYDLCADSDTLTGAATCVFSCAFS